MDDPRQRNHYAVAPWPTSLKLVSAFATLVLIGAGLAAYRAIPVASGFTHHFGLGVAAIPLCILVFALFFIVSGYTVEGNVLLVERLVSSTKVPLDGLQKAYLDPKICKGSLRVFGNGGLFGFTGLYWKKGLGRYRLFATDLSKPVVLFLPDRVVVVTPDHPHALLGHLHHLFPGAVTLPQDSSPRANDPAQGRGKENP